MQGFWSMIMTLLVQTGVSGTTLLAPAIAPALLAAMGLPLRYVGMFASVLFISGTISSVYAVTLVKRVGPIRTSQIALLMAAIGAAVLATLHPWALLPGAMFMGIGLGQVTPASSDILARTAPANRYALVFSIKQTGVPLGGVLAGLLGPPTVVYFGPQWAALEFTAICLIAMVGVQTQRAELDALRKPDTPWPNLLMAFVAPVRLVMGQPALRVLCLGCVVFAMVQHAVASFLVTYLNSSLGWTLIAAGIGFSVAQVAGAVGRVAWSVVADRIGGGMPVMFALAVLMALFSIFMWGPGPGTPTWIVLFLVVLLGATGVGWNGVFLAQVAREVPHAQVALATAGSLVFTYGGVIVGPALFGAVAQATGDMGLTYALLAVPLTPVILLLGSYLWRERRARPR